MFQSIHSFPSVFLNIKQYQINLDLWDWHSTFCNRRPPHVMQRSNLVLEHGTRVRYSLGTNVNSPSPTLEFGHVRDLQCTRAKKWALSPCVHIVFVSSSAFNCFVFVAKLMFQNGVWQGEMGYLWTRDFTYRLLKVWTQQHFVPVPKPRHWFPSTKCGQLISVFPWLQTLHFWVVQDMIDSTL